MAQEKVVKLGVRREPGHLYWVSGTEVWRGPTRGRMGDKQRVAAAQFEREQGYLYFLDSEGDLARSPQNRGGRRGRSSAMTAERPELRAEAPGPE